MAAPPPPTGNNTPLPEGWAEAFTEEGGRYYFNASTGATSWELPASTAAFGLKRRDSRSLASDIGSPTAAVKAMNVSAAKEAESIAPRLALLQAANGDLAEARAAVQQKSGELKTAADKASMVAMNAVQVAAAVASQAHGSADGAKKCCEVEEAAGNDLDAGQGQQREIHTALEKVGKETEAALQTKAVCDAEVGAAVAEAANAEQAYAAALDAANDAARRGEDARALVVSTEARAAAAQHEAKIHKEESLQWAEQVMQDSACLPPLHHCPRPPCPHPST